jgi:hypothetical protein
MPGKFNHRYIHLQSWASFQKSSNRAHGSRNITISSRQQPMRVRRARLN